MKRKLAIITTHPIQYYAPLFRLLSESEKIEIHVFYTWSQSQHSVKDKEFGQEIVWDIPLLDGYPYTFVENISKYPHSHFRGLQNPSLIPLIKQWKADAILVVGWNFQSHLKAMWYFKGKIPVYFRGDSTLLDEKPGLKKIARYILLRWVYTHVDKAFYVGTRNKDYFLRFGLTMNQLCFAPHAIDNTRFSDISYEKEAIEWRKKLGYNEDDIVLLYTGKFIPVKNVVYLVQQFNIFCSQYPDTKLKLLLVGNGIQEETLKNLSVDNSRIKIMPFQNQTMMPVIYRTGNVFVLPSNSETWGLGVNEAMASGRAVIVTSQVGCAIDLIHEGENGYYLDLYDTSKNIQLFSKLNLPDLAIMGNKNRDKIRHWSYENIICSIEKLLRDE
jgi:glycosyltransferase involved in cell wall biosynthesis